MWIHIFAYSDTYAFWRSSEPFGFLQHLYILNLWNVLHTCPPSLNVLSRVHTSCISTSPNIQHHPHMCYMLPEPSHIHRHTSLHIPSYSRYTISHVWTSSCMKAHVCQISGIIHTWHAEYLQCLWKHLDTNSVDSTAFIMLWYASLNISIAQGHATMLSPVSILPHQFSIFCLFFKNSALTSDQLSSKAIPHLHSLR